MEKIRLSKYFTDCGVMSRRAAEDEIVSGTVTVNGEKATLGQKIDPENDVIEYKGKKISPDSGEKICIMLNKPRGIVCTASDEKGRDNVTMLCSDVTDKSGKKVRLYPIGRLDMDSDGLLLLTNDGELANILTHPRHSIPKIYQVTISGFLSDEDISKLGEPIMIDGKKTNPVQTRRISASPAATVVEFRLFEGRNRQIRRMCDAHGAKITKLTRIAIGSVSLGSLPIGKWRVLTSSEITYLKKSSFDQN